jgi:hypothetical protein
MLTKCLVDYSNPGETLRFGSVIYKRLMEIDDGAIDDCIETLPFLKRWPYRFEKEFRVIWEGDTDGPKIGIDLKMIKRITISQLMPKPFFKRSKNIWKRSFQKQKSTLPRFIEIRRNGSMYLQ